MSGLRAELRMKCYEPAPEGASAFSGMFSCKRDTPTMQTSGGTDMSSKKQETVRINLTASQVQEVKTATGRDADAIELTLEELEERIAPNADRLASNSNETLLSG